MKKTLSLSLLLVAGVSSSYATGLSFQTLSPIAGEFRLSDGTSTVTSGSLIRFGTMSVSDFTGFTTIGQFESVFTELSTGAFTIGGDATGSIATGTIGEGVSLFAIAYNGLTVGNVESAVISLGSTPSFGPLAGSPATSTALYGSNSGSNINFAPVPEPSTYAALAGLFALSFVMVRRRRA